MRCIWSSLSEPNLENKTLNQLSSLLVILKLNFECKECDVAHKNQ
jgi:hypothetical protein